MTTMIPVKLDVVNLRHLPEENDGNFADDTSIWEGFLIKIQRFS